MIEYPEELRRLARETPWFFSALCAVRELGLDSWCIGAGAVRNLVWDALHAHRSPSSLSDIDVAYFDPSCLDGERDATLECQLRSRYPDVPWEVTNQAAVHLWFEGYFGHAVEPLHSLREAVGTWPEFATSVGLTLREDGSIDIIAPHGMDDLFNIIVRRNPTRVSLETYRQRVAMKRYEQRWPMVTVVPA